MPYDLVKRVHEQRERVREMSGCRNEPKFEDSDYGLMWLQNKSMFVLWKVSSQGHQGGEHCRCVRMLIFPRTI